jgi:hypothetical protein
MEHKKLGSHHLATAEKILAHPTSHNLEWRDVTALLKEIGSIEEEANGRFVDTQQTVDLRRMLNAAGFTTENLGS